MTKETKKRDIVVHSNSLQDVANIDSSLLSLGIIYRFNGFTLIGNNVGGTDVWRVEPYYDTQVLPHNTYHGDLSSPFDSNIQVVSNIFSIKEFGDCFDIKTIIETIQKWLVMDCFNTIKPSDMDKIRKVYDFMIGLRCVTFIPLDNGNMMVIKQPKITKHHTNQILEDVTNICKFLCNAKGITLFDLCVEVYTGNDYVKDLENESDFYSKVVLKRLEDIL